MVTIDKVQQDTGVEALEELFGSEAAQAEVEAMTLGRFGFDEELDEPQAIALDQGVLMRRLWLVLTAALAVLVGSTVVPVVVPTASAANTYLTNPLGFAYNSVTGVAQYGHPTGMLVTGRCDRYAPEFAAARANGAEVLAYLSAPSRPDSPVCPLDSEFYMGNPSQVPLWPYPTPGQRVNYPNTHMTDIRVGSVWANHVVAYIENLMREDKVDGVFLDVLGARLWSSLSAWNSWPQWEKDAWTAGSIDLVRRLDAKRRAINPRFILINNNVWDTPDGAGLAGEQYVDGISLEHHSPTSAYHQRVAGKPYGNLGHRRVLAIPGSTAEARQWATVQGVTHVSDQQTYGSVTPPPIGFHRLTDRPKTFGRTTIAANPSKGMAANQKRGSKFTLPDKATLLGFSAYLDGGGATTGSQTVRMVLYRDNNGVPGGRWAQSNIVTIAAGTPGRWVNFSAPATPLDPGQYWIVLHTGDTTGIARNRGGDGPANWYGNLDAFADGPANPFGPGAAGTGTLSVKATYTVGH
jgi:hypothetical protein